MGIVVRGIGEDELEGFTRTCYDAFGNQPADEEVADELVAAGRLAAASEAALALADLAFRGARAPFCTMAF